LEPAILIHEVSKSFGTLKAVDQLDLKIQQGEYVALLGPNGAGKTTLIEMIEGIQKPDKGQITILGKNWNSHEKALHKEIGLSLQETKFIEKLKVRETALLFASFYQLSAQRVDEVLTSVNLTSKANSFVYDLSGGQRQRLALGIALLNEPKIILLDEPTTGLDPTSRREIWSILEDLKTKGTTMILTTHYMEEAQVLCDRILIMDKGKFIAQGKLGELIGQYGEGDVIEFTLNSELQSSIDTLPGLKKTSWENPNLKGRIWVESLAMAIPQFTAMVTGEGLEFLELECRKMTLDDLFIYMTGRNLNE
jgi:ABC-2 type transport system ATP-binding protein